MKTIVFANQKGGVAKSTSSTATASILNRMGHKTLFIDSDQQTNSTDTYKAKIQGATTLYDVLLEAKPVSINQAIQHTENGDIVAADPLLTEADSKLAGNPKNFFKLKEALKDLTGYEYVIIDTNPSFNMMLQNALVAADDVVIPVTADRYGIQGLMQLNETINSVRYINKDLKIAGLLLTRYNRRANLSKDLTEILEQVAKKLGTKVFHTTIRESQKAKEAQTQQMLLIDYAPSSTTAEDYEDFVKELIKVVH